MNAFKKVSLATCALAMTGLMYGCGTDEPPTPANPTITGVVQQGAVANAFVFLDLNGNGTFDAGEPNAITSATGAYSLTVLPSQAAAAATAKIIVNFPVNSIDTVTKTRPTGILTANAPTGVGTTNTIQNITAISTLVASVPAGPTRTALLANLATLGQTDPNGPVANSPAILALVKSVETVVAASQSGVAAVGGTAASANKVGNDVVLSLANAIAGIPTATLQNSATLAATLATTLPAAAAATIAAEPTTGAGAVFTAAPSAAALTTSLTTAVNTVTAAVQAGVTANGGGAGLSTSTALPGVTEANVLTTANAAAIDNANSAATIAVAANVAADVAPPVSNGVVPSVSTANNNQTVALPIPAIFIQFSENVKASTVTNVNITLSNGGPVSGVVTYDPIAFIATFTPSTPLAAGVTYTISLSAAIVDLSGAALVPTTLRFTTTAAPTGATGGTGGSTGGTGINF